MGKQRQGWLEPPVGLRQPARQFLERHAPAQRRAPDEIGALNDLRGEAGVIGCGQNPLQRGVGISPKAVNASGAASWWEKPPCSNTASVQAG